MHIKTLSAVALLLATVLPATVHAGSVLDAAEHMTKLEQRREALARMRAKAGVDTTTTASVRSDNAYDARGVVVPNAEVTLQAGIAARIDAMPLKAGQRFQAGETLVQFDCARQEADLRGAEATLQRNAALFATKERLQARGAAGAQEVRDARSEMQTARASADALREVITYCRIKAPFGGRVVERHAETFEIPAANAPLLTVVDDSSLELDLIVPSTWLRWLKTGTTFSFSVDELGTAFQARVQRLGAKVDAVSQTVKITGAFAKHPQQVLTGMSGTATFDPPAMN